MPDENLNEAFCNARQLLNDVLLVQW